MIKATFFGAGYSSLDHRQALGSIDSDCYGFASA